MLEILLDATVRSGTPILFATLGAIINERAGIINLGIEGLMLIGALAGFAGTQASGSQLHGNEGMHAPRQHRGDESREHPDQQRPAGLGAGKTGQGTDQHQALNP